MSDEFGSEAKKICLRPCTLQGGVGGYGSSECPLDHASGNHAERTDLSSFEKLPLDVLLRALSLLDFVDLCSLSMVSSPAKKTADNDITWKKLYFKDFKVEGDDIKPDNGWKAYYAATKSVIDLNAKFYNALHNKALEEMSLIWLDAVYVTCMHASGEILTGYSAVMESWGRTFNCSQGGEADGFVIQDTRTCVVGGVAWVTMNSRPLHVTNIFQLHHGRWYMVHHHLSIAHIINNVFDNDNDEALIIIHDPDGHHHHYHHHHHHLHDEEDLINLDDPNEHHHHHLHDEEEPIIPNDPEEHHHHHHYHHYHQHHHDHDGPA